jgi:hypothetical protein
MNIKRRPRVYSSHPGRLVAGRLAGRRCKRGMSVPRLHAPRRFCRGYRTSSLLPFNPIPCNDNMLADDGRTVHQPGLAIDLRRAHALQRRSLMILRRALWLVPRSLAASDRALCSGCPNCHWEKRSNIRMLACTYRRLSYTIPRPHQAPCSSAYQPVKDVSAATWNGRGGFSPAALQQWLTTDRALAPILQGLT